MRSVVTIIFNNRQSLELTTDVDPAGQAPVAARDWFDATWTRLGCEPLRPSGKVLLLDKILGVADALGYAKLSQDEQQAHEYARQAALALEKPRITVDLPGLVVGF
ncbi:hypothetical protein [Pollutimonas sp. M17]|uniref:hypothetical protein n=1 Tax=Pollutimonas sp. M17 TaxID=2962065 RepID=UPI0021F4F349|nr:hypothetical protein [Pollutimonas sp. M17]UYO93825.1 hypothetical protein OEG81_00410 [Pollutimonas sp. M17]HWK69332.1 hypothetical protein [Burkholderiaceae bacterium]